MHFNRTLASAAAITALLTAGCADTTLVAPAAMDLVSSASVAGSPYGVDATEVRLAPGATHQLDATKTANGKAVPNSSVTWSSADPSVATVSSTGLVTAVAAGQTTVIIARGSHADEVTVIVDGCGLRSLTIGTTQESISESDCALGSRFADIYGVNLGMGEVVRFEAAGIAGGRQGLRVPGATLLDGVFQSVPMGFGVRVIGNGNPFHAIAASSTLGSYTMTASMPSEAHDCDDYNFLLPGTSFGTTLTAANSCEYPVQFGVIPEANGMPLHAHFFNMYVEGGKSYTVTITGVSDTFNPALTVFAGGVLAQSGPDGNPAPATRTVTFSRATNGFVGVEVAMGRFVGGLAPENWVIEHGTYTMTVSQ